MKTTMSASILLLVSLLAGCQAIAPAIPTLVDATIVPAVDPETGEPVMETVIDPITGSQITRQKVEVLEPSGAQLERIARGAAPFLPPPWDAIASAGLTLASALRIRKQGS